MFSGLFFFIGAPFCKVKWSVDRTFQVRHALELDYVPAGVSPQKDDNIVYDIKDGKSTSGWGHPVCAPAAVEVAKNLPKIRKK